MSDQNVKAAQKYLNAMFGGHKDLSLIHISQTFTGLDYFVGNKGASHW